MGDGGCGLAIAMLALIALIGFGVFMAKNDRATGYREAMTVVACPALLAHSPTLADSLAIAQQHPLCEWWDASTKAAVQP